MEFLGNIKSIFAGIVDFSRGLITNVRNTITGEKDAYVIEASNVDFNEIAGAITPSKGFTQQNLPVSPVKKVFIANDRGTEYFYIVRENFNAVEVKRYDLNNNEKSIISPDILGEYITIGQPDVPNIPFGNVGARELFDDSSDINVYYTFNSSSNQTSPQKDFRYDDATYPQGNTYIYNIKDLLYTSAVYGLWDFVVPVANSSYSLNQIKSQGYHKKYRYLSLYWEEFTPSGLVQYLIPIGQVVYWEYSKWARDNPDANGVNNPNHRIYLLCNPGLNRKLYEFMSGSQSNIFYFVLTQYPILAGIYGTKFMDFTSSPSGYESFVRKERRTIFPLKSKEVKPIEVDILDRKFEYPREFKKAWSTITIASLESNIIHPQVDLLYRWGFEKNGLAIVETLTWSSTNTPQRKGYYNFLITFLTDDGQEYVPAQANIGLGYLRCDTNIVSKLRFYPFMHFIPHYVKGFRVYVRFASDTTEKTLNDFRGSYIPQGEFVFWKEVLFDNLKPEDSQILAFKHAFGEFTATGTYKKLYPFTWFVELTFTDFPSGTSSLNLGYEIKIDKTSYFDYVNEIFDAFKNNGIKNGKTFWTSSNYIPQALYDAPVYYPSNPLTPGEITDISFGYGNRFFVIDNPDFVKFTPVGITPIWSAFTEDNILSVLNSAGLNSIEASPQLGYIVVGDPYKIHIIDVRGETPEKWFKVQELPIGISDKNNLYLTPNGLVILTPRAGFISDMKERYVEFTAEIANIYRAQYPFMVFYSNNKLWFIGSSKILIYNFLYKNWTAIDKMGTAQIMGGFINPQTGEVGYYTSDGVVYSPSNDYSTGTKKFRTPWIDYGNPLNIKAFSEIVLTFKGTGTLRFYTDYNLGIPVYSIDLNFVNYENQVLRLPRIYHKVFAIEFESTGTFEFQSFLVKSYLKKEIIKRG